MSAITAAPMQPTRLSATLLRMVRAEWERALAWTLAVGAAVLLFVGYRNLAASPFAAEEVAHLITGGIGALVLLVASVGLLLTADLRDEADKLDRIDARLGRSGSFSADRPAPAGVAASGDGAGARPRRGARIASAGAVVLGLVALVAGWARAAGTADFDRSLTGLAVAVIGFALVTAGIAVGSLAARRSVRRRIGVLVDAGFRSAARPAGEVGASDGREWTADGLARFHRRSCPALLSATGAARLVDGPAARLEPCLLCHVED
jgi:hypothetical protein